MIGPHAGGGGFCRHCFETFVHPDARRCPHCNSPRVVVHPEIFDLAIAHIDCDAFYAAVEKRDNPELVDKPVIVGGEKRGVVSTACYVARIKGVKSAMPMFKAKKLCPEAVVLRGDMAKYVRVGREVRALMKELTPLVEPLSIDEAFLDLSGTQKLFGQPPALSLAKLSARIEDEIGITVSIGLSHNKFLAKIASDLDKPRGFSVIGAAETAEFLADKPADIIWGVGKAMQKSLARHGITHIHQLRQLDKVELMKKFGTLGARLYHLSRGEDKRRVVTGGDTKSISNETTFFEDETDAERLVSKLWLLCENVSRRAKAKQLAGRTITVKLKTAKFVSRTRSTTLIDGTNLAERIFAAARPLLEKEADGTAFRLLGVGISHLEEMPEDAETQDLDAFVQRQTKTEKAMDAVRGKFGRDAVAKGRGLQAKNRPSSKD